MLELNALCVTFNVGCKGLHAVKNATLSIADGEVFGIVGTSGAGKSTLLRTINLLQKPTSGSILVDGIDITRFKGKDLRELRSSIGMVFQHFNLIYTKTVYDNIAFPLRVLGTKRTEVARRVPELLELVGLTDKARAYPAKLSGGQKQRVGIARALANGPKVLLCDEPTSALDLETTNAILDLLKDINKKLGITIVLISHEMVVVKKICTKVAVMSEGEIVEVGSAYNIFAAPVHPFTRQLVENTLDLELPDRLLNDVRGTLVKVLYKGARAEEPVLSDMIRTFAVGFNMLHGKIEYIGGQPLGIVLLDITGQTGAVAESIEYLKARTASVEVISGVEVISAVEVIHG
jgi:D-methionine transport system ATP-binding protein